MFDGTLPHGVQLREGECGVTIERVSEEGERAASTLEDSKELLSGLNENGARLTLDCLVPAPSRESNQAQQREAGEQGDDRRDHDPSITPHAFILILAPPRGKQGHEGGGRRV